MLQKQIVWLIVLALTCCFATAAVAQDTCPGMSETEEPAVTSQDTTPPVGAGPVEVVPGIAVAPVATIERRGHVQNICESQVMTTQLIKQHGGMRKVGDYNVAYIVLEPRGWYEMKDGVLTWIPPAPGQTQHIEAVVLDALTNKPIPVSQVMVDVIDQQGKVVQSQQLGYYWHPMSDHFGTNYSIPTAGTYSLRVRAPAPAIRRHSRQLGERFTAPVDITFTNVRLTPLPPLTERPPVGAGPEPDTY